MLIDPQHEGASGLDFETWEGSNASVARDHSPEVGQCPGFRHLFPALDLRPEWRLGVLVRGGLLRCSFQAVALASNGPIAGSSLLRQDPEFLCKVGKTGKFRQSPGAIIGRNRRPPISVLGSIRMVETTKPLRITKWQALRGFVTACERLDSRAPRRIPGWVAASKLARDFHTMSQAVLKPLAGAYDRSKKCLFPLSDPLDARFPLHRQLSSDREEVYSDWLQWVLQQFSDPRSLGRILGSPNLARLANPEEPVSVDREITVEHGYAGQAGRLDLVLRQRSRRLIVVEVKTRAYEDADLEKHAGYTESIDSSETEFVFLAVNPPDTGLHGFRFVSWAEVCVVLRSLARSRLGPDHVLSTALILAFVGAVEQNLLGFVSPESASLPVGNAPRMLDHLIRAERME